MVKQQLKGHQQKGIPSKDKRCHGIVTWHVWHVKKLFILAMNGENATHTSFPEKVKRHQVHHGVLDVVDLLFKRQLWREQTRLFQHILISLIFSQLKQKCHYFRPLKYCLDGLLSQS